MWNYQNDYRCAFVGNIIIIIIIIVVWYWELLCWWNGWIKINVWFEVFKFQLEFQLNRLIRIYFGFSSKDIVYLISDIVYLLAF